MTQPASSDPAAQPLPDVRARVGEHLMRRDIGLLAAIAVIINATIGTGIFKSPGRILRLTGTEDAALAIWVLGGIIAFCGALSLAELAAALPRTGGMYEHLKRAWGKKVAFLFIWTRLVLLVPAAIGTFALLAGDALVALLNLTPDPTTNRLFSVGVIVVAAALNVVAVKQSAIQQVVVTGAKYLGVLLLAGVGLLIAVPPYAPPPIPIDVVNATTVTGAGIFAALVAVMWVYDGWADLAHVAGEVRNPAKNMPRALAIGALAITAVYLLVNLGYLRVLGGDGLRSATTGADMVAARLGAATFGELGQRVVSGLVLVSCLGAAMGMLLTGPRTFVPVSADGEFVRWLGHVSPKTGVPWPAVLTCAALGSVFVWSRTFEQLSEAFVAGAFPFYTLVVLAVPMLRRREPNLKRPFRVPLYPLPVIVFVAGATALMVGAVQEADIFSVVALAVVLAGLGVEALYRRSRASVA
ncbi:MAG: APC family permease [Myxococcota bacterium]